MKPAAPQEGLPQNKKSEAVRPRLGMMVGLA
jgi:hypothetical protein